MKFEIETKFDIGDFVGLKTEEKITGTKMLISAIGIDFGGEISYLCVWIKYGTTSRVPFSEISLIKWGE